MRRFIPSDKNKLTVEVQPVTPSQQHFFNDYGEPLDHEKLKKERMVHKVALKRQKWLNSTAEDPKFKDRKL